MMFVTLSARPRDIWLNTKHGTSASTRSGTAGYKSIITASSLPLSVTNVLLFFFFLFLLLLLFAFFQTKRGLRSPREAPLQRKDRNRLVNIRAEEEEDFSYLVRRHARLKCLRLSVRWVKVAVTAGPVRASLD